MELTRRQAIHLTGSLCLGGPLCPGLPYGHWIETTFCGKECRYDKYSGVDTFCFGVDTFCLGVDTICSGVAKLTLKQQQKMHTMPSMVIFVMSNVYT